VRSDSFAPPSAPKQEVDKRVADTRFQIRERVVNRKDQRQLETVRRGRDDTAEHIEKSREAIEDSMTLLQGSDRKEVGQKPKAHRPPSEGRVRDRAAKEKRRANRSVRRPAAP
jgi:translation initiation factor 2 beta subunit (eIF-2beta)/eIF-5